MSVLMICAGTADGPVHDVSHAPWFLMTFDPDDPQEQVIWTTHRPSARRFADLTEAMTLWKTASTVRPLRDDGLPNRPLTAFHVTFETVE